MLGSGADAFRAPALLRMDTGGADSEEENLMSFRDTAGKGRFCLLQDTPRNIEETVAGMAMKIMVMFFVCSFVENT